MPNSFRSPQVDHQLKSGWLLDRNVSWLRAAGLDLGATLLGNPSFVMSASFTNQTLAQIELYANNKDGKYAKKVYVLPKTLDEKVARLRLAEIGVKLTELRKDQADYIGVKPEGPYKSDHYRY